MKFVKLQGSDEWLLWEEEYMFLSNIKGGGQRIDENSPAWINAYVEEADSWYAICKKHSYYPNATSYKRNCSWLSPDGLFIEADAHACAAEYICQYLYDITDMDIEWCDDYLRQHGWVKLTTSVMYQIYYEDGMYDHLTQPQRDSIRLWADCHCMDYPWSEDDED